MTLTKLQGDKIFCRPKRLKLAQVLILGLPEFHGLERAVLSSGRQSLTLFDMEVTIYVPLLSNAA